MTNKNTSVPPRLPGSVLLLALCVWWSAGPAAAHVVVRAAGCFIATPDGVVMTVGRFDDALQLPAGAREAGESPACTAQRETREETGLEVEVAEPLLSTRAGFVLFRCVPRDALEPDRTMRPLDWLEVAEVLILDPLTLRTPQGALYRNRWRFERDRAIVYRLFREGLPAAAQVQRDLQCAPVSGRSEASR